MGMCSGCNSGDLFIVLLPFLLLLLVILRALYPKNIESGLVHQALKSNGLMATRVELPLMIPLTRIPQML